MGEPGEAVTFQIRYYLNGGNGESESLFAYGREDLPLALSVPKRAGYNFAGWYTESALKNKITRITATTAGDYALYAKWTRRIRDEYNVQTYSYQNHASSGLLNQKLRDCSYAFLEDLEIPGMPSTREEDARENRITDTSQCPQGICLTEDYLLVSAYSTGGGGNLGCIYMFDRESHEYLGTLGMRGQSHLGGLSYDGENVWLCHSDNNTLECIPYGFVQRIASKKPKSVVDCSALFEAYHISNSPSCITCHDGLIWVATHTKVLNSVMIAYKPTADGLRQAGKCRIPDKVQGIAFDEKGMVYLSTSYGRKKSSYLKVYASAERLNRKPNRPIAKVEMPPCSEEICLEDDEIYVLFESASEKYLEGTDGLGGSLSPIDEVLVLTRGSVFQ